MIRKTVTIICSVVFIASMLTIPKVCLASAVKTAVSGEMIQLGVGVPDKEWVAGDNMHLRGITEMGEVTGNLEGTYSVVGNYHLNMLTGEGQSFGKLTLVLTFNGLSGTFEGTYVGKLSDFGFSLTIYGVTHGISEEVEGMKFMGTAVWSTLDGSYAYEGFILDPQGE